MRIAVVALGKIGLPLAVQYADKGHEVIEVDVNPAVIEDEFSQRLNKLQESKPMFHVKHHLLNNDKRKSSQKPSPAT